MKEVAKLLLLLVQVVVNPLVIIWAINTLLPIAQLGYNWRTWLAVVVVYNVGKIGVSKCSK